MQNVWAHLEALEEVDLAVAAKDGEDAVRVAHTPIAPAPHAPALATVHGHVALVVLRGARFEDILQSLLRTG